MSKAYDKLSKENYVICVPSRERAFLVDERRGIWRYIDPRKVSYTPKYNTAIILRKNETLPYENMDIPAIVKVPVPNTYTIADKRNHAMKTAVGLGSEYLFIIDDDVMFYYREEKLSSKYTSKWENFVERDVFNKILLESIQLCNEQYPIVGLPLKQGSFGLKYMFPKNIPIIRFVCYHVPTLKKEGIRATGLNTTFMSDRYVHLKLLSKGYRSISNCRYCIGDYGTGYKGGCSITRTVELQTEAAELLQKEFPNHVSLKWKEDGVWNVRRKDCKINWKKFLDEGEVKYMPASQGLKILGCEEEQNDIES